MIYLSAGTRNMHAPANRSKFTDKVVLAYKRRNFLKISKEHTFVTYLKGVYHFVPGVSYPVERYNKQQKIS